MKKLQSKSSLPVQLFPVETVLNNEIAKMSRAKKHPTVNWINWLYDCDSIKSAKAGEAQTELIAQYICQNFDSFSTQFSPLDRFDLAHSKSVPLNGFYNIFNRISPSQDRIHRNIKLQRETNQDEKNIARLMRRKSRDNCFAFDTLGQVLNFEIPLGEKKQGRGNIDLVSYNGMDEHPLFYLLELKKADSTESLLRCTLEIYTYFKTIKRPAKFLADFGVPDNTKIILAPLFFEHSTDMQSNSSQFNELLFLQDKSNKAATHWERQLFNLIRKDVSNTFADPEFNHLTFIPLKDSEMGDVLSGLKDESLYI